MKTKVHIHCIFVGGVRGWSSLVVSTLVGDSVSDIPQGSGLIDLVNFPVAFLFPSGSSILLSTLP